MAVEYTHEVGEYRGRAYELTVRAAPDLDRVSDFAVVLHYEDQGERVEVARIDSSHSQVHFDRLYRRDQPKDPLDVDVWEAEALLAENWRRYARTYERNHGDPGLAPVTGGRETPAHPYSELYRSSFQGFAVFE